MTTVEKLLLANLAGEAILAGLLVRSHNKLIDERNAVFASDRIYSYMGLRRKKEYKKYEERHKSKD